jgi:hypothetical protein
MLSSQKQRFSDQVNADKFSKGKEEISYNQTLYTIPKNKVLFSNLKQPV